MGKPKLNLSEYFWATLYLRTLSLIVAFLSIEMNNLGNVISASVLISSALIVLAIAEYMEFRMKETRGKMMMEICDCPCHYPKSIRRYLGIEVAKHHKCLCKKEIKFRNDDEPDWNKEYKLKEE